MSTNRTFEEYIPSGLSLSVMRQKILPKNILTAKGGIYVCNGNNNPIMYAPDHDGQILISADNQDLGVIFSDNLDGQWVSDIPIESLLNSDEQPANKFLATNDSGEVNWTTFDFSTFFSGTINGCKFTNLLSDYTSSLINFQGVTKTDNTNNNSFFRPLPLDTAVIGQIINPMVGNCVIKTDLSHDNHCLTIIENYLDENFYNWNFNQGITIPTSTTDPLSTKLYFSFNFIDSSSRFPGDVNNLKVHVELYIPSGTSYVNVLNTTKTFKTSDASTGIDISISARHRTRISNAITNQTPCVLLIDIFNASDNRKIQQSNYTVILSAALPAFDADFTKVLSHNTGLRRSLTATTTFKRNSMAYQDERITVMGAEIYTEFGGTEHSFELRTTSLTSGQEVTTTTEFAETSGGRYNELKTLIQNHCSFTFSVQAFTDVTVQPFTVLKVLGELSYLPLD